MIGVRWPAQIRERFRRTAPLARSAFLLETLQTKNGRIEIGEFFTKLP